MSPEPRVPNSSLRIARAPRLEMFSSTKQLGGSDTVSSTERKWLTDCRCCFLTRERPGPLRNTTAA
eukprot:14011187-Alexandrium_andersonii.AAC.1